MNLNFTVEDDTCFTLLFLSQWRWLRKVTSCVASSKEQAGLWSTYVIRNLDSFGEALASLPLCFLPWRDWLNSITSLEPSFKEAAGEIFRLIKIIDLSNRSGFRDAWNSCGWYWLGTRCQIRSITNLEIIILKEHGGGVTFWPLTISAVTNLNRIGAAVVDCTYWYLAS